MWSSLKNTLIEIYEIRKFLLSIRKMICSLNYNNSDCKILIFENLDGNWK
jgi:hypothetical protein